MARKSNFDRDEKLIEAMQLFWQQGYANTSISDLVAHLGINRFSIYNAFGDKYALYQEALEYYFEHTSKPAAQMLFYPEADLHTLESFLLAFVERQKQQQFGCFIQNALLEHGPRDQSVQGVGNKLTLHLSDGVTHCLSNAIKLGQLHPQADLSGLVSLIVTHIQGIRVLGKAAQYGYLETATQALFGLLKSQKLDSIH